MEEPLLQHRDERGVVALTLNRRQALNALSEAMLAALGKAFDAMAKDEPVRAVVLGRVGQGVVLPPARAGHRVLLRRRRRDDGLQHDGPERARGRTGLHRQARAELGSGAGVKRFARGAG
jgi:hypothetical protein